MNAIHGLTQMLATAAIGLLVGALLMEGCLLVPFWRSLRADRFHALYRDLHPRLYRYFSPLTIGTLVLSLASAGAGIAVSSPGMWATAAAAALTLFAAGTHVIYFGKANTTFAQGTLSDVDLTAELVRWSAWNWARVGLGLLALGTSIVGIRQG
jgi:hypothetical protein